jgi:uncharacterized damage-inducible protein DinB/GNAT superfamily N-acetyltransferase
MDLAYLRTLVDYHYWARDRVLDAVSRLDAAQYAHATGGSFGSVRDTLNHTYGAEVLWLRRWHGESPTAFPGEMPVDATSLRAAWREQETALRAFVDTLDDRALERVVSYRNLAGVPGESAIWEMLAHVVNHATYHRGQITTLLRQLGATPPASTDMIVFFRERARFRVHAEAVAVRAYDAADAPVIAKLHTMSWQRAYRGILSDAYLDNGLLDERSAVWDAKLSATDAGPGWMALVQGEPAGFVYVRPREDARWGTLVDNLHVLAAHQGRGIGRRLLHTVGEWGVRHAPHDAVHLWVFADNHAARGFYARVGGTEVERVDREASDGRLLPEYRVSWPSPSALVSATRSG